jgi:methionine sulfoxide reductase heme-binding subunit
VSIESPTTDTPRANNARSKPIPWVFWTLLSVPALGMLISALLGKATMPLLLHGSGEFSARFLVVTLLATPLAMLFPNVRWIRWVVLHRRHFGVAAFLYALLHTVFYVVREGTLAKLIAALADPAISTGWLALLIFVPLAITSTDASMRRLGKNWKKLHRLSYIAAALTAAHWLLLGDHAVPVLVHFGPVVLLAGYRVWRMRAG